MAAKGGGKNTEARALVAEAEKHLKTSLLKWKPDYDSAAASYTKAGVAFKNAGALAEAQEAYVSAAKCQMAMTALFHAAKSLEQAAFIAKDTKNFDEAASLVERAANLYLEGGTPDTAAISLSRAAKMIEITNPDRAVHLYQRAADVAESEGRAKQAAEYIREVSRLLIRIKRHVDAAVSLQKEIRYYNSDSGDNHQVVGKSVMGLILLNLYHDDHFAARRAYDEASIECRGFAASDDGSAVLQLLEAVEKGDDDMAAAALALPAFKYLDNDFAKLARDIRARKSNKPAATTVQQTSSGVSKSVADTAGQHDDADEEEGGLC